MITFLLVWMCAAVVALIINYLLHSTNSNWEEPSSND
jgi:preprotein translocase subunit SecG